MLQYLAKFKIPYGFALAGIVFIFLSMFSVQDITKGQVTYIDIVRRVPFTIGTCFIILSIIWYVIPYIASSITWAVIFKVKKVKNGFQMEIAHVPVEVFFGKIEQFYNISPKGFIALPANDLFDDDCIRDPRSALGSFICNMFPNQVHEICNLVREQINKLPIVKTREEQVISKRYQIGTTVYLDQPLNRDLKIAFLAVTNVTDRDGIRCDVSNIFNAIKGLHNLMNRLRLDTLVIPVIGSGHGGVSPPISLICMLIAFAENIRQPSGHHIKYVRIVVYQKDKLSKPAISYWQVRRLLAFVQRYC
jgi:hypothetical protein